NAIGRVRLVYANFDDGIMGTRDAPWMWRNESGIAWPAKDEFEVGCTFVHAGYLLTWLAAFFGPARFVTSFSACLHDDKGIPVDKMAPDLVVGCIEYADGIVARVTCSLLAPRDKSLTIIGDEGVLMVPDVRNDACPVYMRRIPASRIQGGIERRINSCRRWAGIRAAGAEWHIWAKYSAPKRSANRFVSLNKPVDFCRGPADLVEAINEKRDPRLSGELGWHITELVENLQQPNPVGGRRELI